MGGDVSRSIATEMPVQGPYDVGRGYRIYLTISPSGNMFVAEATTGAIVRNSVEAVRKDIEEGDPKVMDEQMEWARKEGPKAEPLQSKTFWARMREL